jgi:hypothetical protein
MWQAREDQTLGQSPVVSTGLGPVAFGALGSSLHKNRQKLGTGVCGSSCSRRTGSDHYLALGNLSISHQTCAYERDWTLGSGIWVRESSMFCVGN